MRRELRTDTCQVLVHPTGAGSKFQDSEQCSRKRGFGKDGLYCKYHATMFDKRAKKEAEQDANIRARDEEDERERNRITALESDNAALKSEVDNLTSACRNKGDLIIERNKRIAALREQVASLARHQEEEGKMSEPKNTLAIATATALNVRNEELLIDNAALRAEIDEYAEQVKNLEIDVVNWKHFNEQKAEQLAEANARAEKAEGLLAEAQGCLEDLIAESGDDESGEAWASMADSLVDKIGAHLDAHKPPNMIDKPGSGESVSDKLGMDTPLDAARVYLDDDNPAQEQGEG